MGGKGTAGTVVVFCEADGYTAVVPTGLILSVVAVAILLLCTVTGGWTLSYRRGARS